MKVFPNKQQHILLFFIAVFLQTADVHSREAIKIEDIKTISLDEIGILNKTNGGLSTDIWNGSDYKFVESLLVSLPMDITSQTANNLRKQLLLSSATPPKASATDLSSIIIIRLKLLAQLGEYENIGKMITLIPDSAISEQIKQIHTASAFIAEDYANACANVQQLLPQYSSLFWREALIICDAHNKNTSKVSLALNLLQEDGHKPDKEFTTALDSFKKGDASKGTTKWKEILKSGILKLPEIKSVFPDLQKLNYSPLDSTKVAEWFEKNKVLPNDQKIIQAAELYANIEALGSPILQRDWHQFVMYAISNNLPIPPIAIFELLENNISQGETILLTLHSLNKLEAKQIPHFLLVRIIKSLNDSGLEKEALQLAGEAL